MPKTASTKGTDGAVKKKRGSKPKKDSNAPKRALSAYLFYAQENREKVKREHPDATFTEMGKILGENWKAMTDTQKKPYVEKSLKDKVRYDKDKALYESREGAVGGESEEE